jgi:hypothetical protein
MTRTVIIRRRVVRHRYPHSGNVGMTQTAVYAYDLWAQDRLLIPSISTLREAKVWAARLAQESR